MNKADKNGLAIRSVSPWRWALIGVVILSLVVSLATRTFRLTIPHSVIAKSGAGQAVRQHMDRDATKWTSPVRVFTTLRAPTFSPPVAPTGPVPGVLLLDDNLYKRPPPSCREPFC